MTPMRVLGLDPGLRHTGWGIVDSEGYALSFVACGRISTDEKMDLPQRLLALHTGILGVIETYQPHTAAVEETFVNKNAASALKLGFARGVILMSPALCGLDVGEYPANKVKKAVVGVGHADKNQVLHMMRILLPSAPIDSEDAADALAVAVCHAHHVCVPHPAKQRRAG